MLIFGTDKLCSAQIFKLFQGFTFLLGQILDDKMFYCPGTRQLIETK